MIKNRSRRKGRRIDIHINTRRVNIQEEEDTTGKMKNLQGNTCEDIEHDYKIKSHLLVLDKT